MEPTVSTDPTLVLSQEDILNWGRRHKIFLGTVPPADIISAWRECENIIRASIPPQLACEAPVINIKSEHRAANINVIRVEREEDGSFTAITDHWPHDPEENPQLARLLSDHMTWVETTFPDETVEEQIAHLVEEVHELAANPGDREEYGDVMGLLMCVAYRKGINVISAWQDKLVINKTRRWEKTDKGVRHVKEPHEELVRDKAPDLDLIAIEAALESGANEIEHLRRQVHFQQAQLEIVHGLLRLSGAVQPSPMCAMGDREYDSVYKMHTQAQVIRDLLTRAKEADASYDKQLEHCITNLMRQGWFTPVHAQVLWRYRPKDLGKLKGIKSEESFNRVIGKTGGV